MKITDKIKDKTFDILETFAECRDSDERLTAYYWFKEIKAKGINPEEVKLLDFLGFYSRRELTSSDTITRCRRKIQEENPSLRGEKYNLRKNKFQKRVKKDLGYEGGI